MTTNSAQGLQFFRISAPSYMLGDKAQHRDISTSFQKLPS